MHYVSTRGEKTDIFAAAAIVQGIAADGGLFIPTEIPAFSLDELKSLAPLSYQERAIRLLGLFLTDYTPEEITACVKAAYSAEKFASSAVAPLKTLKEKLHVLELWHGPTSAFKDMALQLLPRLLSTALKKTGEKSEIVILVATSGDTGKAALEGFKDVDQIRVLVFYPAKGVSEIQRLQMVTQEGGNVTVAAVLGNFDDTQTGVKKIFTDKKFQELLAGEGYKLSSANSINWGRLVPQIVYYFSAYADLLAANQIQAGEKVNFVVPTGNFGNILAGYYAKCMGLPVNRLICASNSNNVLADFLQTGTYDKRREFYKTLSPSMDIVISSNLERLLYLVSGQNAKKVAAWMNELNTQGVYEVDPDTLAKIQETFSAEWVNDEGTLDTIGRVYQETGYVVDTHTAVAWQAAEKYRQATADGAQCVIVSTASPFKFNASVLSALTKPDEKELTALSEFEILRRLSTFTKWPVPTALAELENKEIRHTAVFPVSGMPAAVRACLNMDLE
ncbi:MAG TPA: threonine synthase [Patescibacteria group bacterium]|nr:threonine synthase [Patescibacteria group bacterium]